VNRWLQAILMTLLVLMSVFALINIHEIGHVVFGRLLGATDARYYLYYEHEGGRAIGYYTYDSSNLSRMAQSVVTTGGLVFTQLTAVWILILRGAWLRHWFSRRLATVAAAVFTLDFPWQVAQAIRADVMNQTAVRGVDLADFTFLVSSEVGINVTLIQGALLLLLLLYVPLLLKLYRLGQTSATVQPMTAGFEN
jgi:hypothetical protein